MGQKLTPGDGTISAGEFNRHVDAADLVLGRQQLGTPSPPLRLDYDTNLVTVKNVTGANRRRGEIVELTNSPLPDFSSGQLWANAVAITSSGHFGVLLNPLAANAIGNRDCQVGGICTALVNVTSSTHNAARSSAGSHVLQSAASGSVRIIQKPVGTGEKTCLVQLNVPQQSGHVLGILQQQLEASDQTANPLQVGAVMPSATANLYVPQMSGGNLAFALLTMGETVYNPKPFVYPSGSVVVLRPFNGYWLVDRDHDSTPRVSIGVVNSALSGSLVPWSINTQVGNLLTTTSQYVLTVACPVSSRPFRWWFSGYVGYVPAGTEQDGAWNVAGAIRRNGNSASLGFSHIHAWDILPAGGHDHILRCAPGASGGFPQAVVLPVSFCGDVLLSKNDALDFQITDGVSQVSSVSGRVEIEPLFAE
jgi:hypothetical protein